MARQEIRPKDENNFHTCAESVARQFFDFQYNTPSKLFLGLPELADRLFSIPTNQQDSYMLSLTGIPLPPGDLPPQDGRANIDDLNLLKPLMQNSQSSLTEANLSVADVNYDDYINIFDVFLILKTMETRYDE